MRTIKSSQREEKKPYCSPKLIRQGHISRVTEQKSGGLDFIGQGPPIGPFSKNSGSQTGTGSEESANKFFDNYYDD